MFEDQPILIVEDNVYLALDLAAAIEELAGRVVGPTALVSEAMDLLDAKPVAAAIVDCHLDDRPVEMLTSRLAQRRVPFVIHAETDPPEPIGKLHPDVPVLRKPIRPHVVLHCLSAEMQKK